MNLDDLYDERSSLLTQRRLRRFPGSAKRRLLRLERRIDRIELRLSAPEREHHAERLEELKRLAEKAQEMLELVTKGDPDVIQDPELYWSGLMASLMASPTVEDDPDFEDPEPLL